MSAVTGSVRLNLMSAINILSVNLSVVRVHLCSDKLHYLQPLTNRFQKEFRGCTDDNIIPLSVTESSVDFQKSILHILGTKTESSDRYIPLFPIVAQLLHRLGSGKYFPFKECTASTLFSRYIEGYKLHDLRHSFGTIQICVEGIDEKTVSLWMGHNDIGTTLDIYTHPEQLDRSTFLRGDLSTNEKKAIYKAEYEQILSIIKVFLTT